MLKAIFSIEERPLNRNELHVKKRIEIKSTEPANKNWKGEMKSFLSKVGFHSPLVQMSFDRWGKSGKVQSWGIMREV